MAKDMWDMFKGVGELKSLDWTSKKRKKCKSRRKKTCNRKK